MIYTPHIKGTVHMKIVYTLYLWKGLCLNGQSKNKQDLLRNKVSLYLLYDDYKCMYQSLPSTSVSTFLCTQNRGPEEVNGAAV